MATRCARPLPLSLSIFLPSSFLPLPSLSLTHIDREWRQEAPPARWHHCLPGVIAMFGWVATKEDGQDQERELQKDVGDLSKLDLP